MHQVATGPYMIQNDAPATSTGRLHARQARSSSCATRTGTPKTSWRPAYADKILFKEGFQDPTVGTKQILSGAADVNGDTPPPRPS